MRFFPACLDGSRIAKLTKLPFIVAVGFGGAGGYLEMNVYKPLIIYNVTHSVAILSDSCTNLRKFLVEGTKPNLKKIKEYVDRSLMLVTALSPVSATTRLRRLRTTPRTTISC